MARKTVTNADLAATLEALARQVEALASQAELRDRVSKLEAQVADLKEQLADRPDGGMLLGAGMGPVTRYSGEAPEDDTEVVEADDMIRAFHQQMSAADTGDSDFVLDDIEVDLGGGVDAKNGRVRFGANAREAARGTAASSRIKFNLRRRNAPKVIE